jgi:hypothetical protein
MLNDLNPYVTSFIVCLTGAWIGSVSLAIWLLFVYQVAGSRGSQTTVSRDLMRALFVPFKIVGEVRRLDHEGRADAQGAPRNTWIRAAMKAAFVALIGFTAWFVLMVLANPLFTTVPLSAVGIAWSFALPGILLFLASIRTYRRT